MKSSALALMTAAALLFGANAASFAQDATTNAPSDIEDCAITPTGESLVSDQENEADQQTATGSESSESDGPGAVDDVECPEDGSAAGGSATGGAAATTTTDATATTTEGAATTELTAEECLALQGAGATPPGESLVTEQESDTDNETATGTESSSSDATGAIDDENPEGCPDLTETNDE